MAIDIRRVICGSIQENCYIVRAEGRDDCAVVDPGDEYPRLKAALGARRVGAVLLTPVLSEYFRTGLVPRFPTLFVSLFLFLAALQSVFTGLCLDVMVTKDRKNYELRLINTQNP